MPRSSSRQPRVTSYDFRTLLTYRILVLSNTLGKGAARLYARRYGVPLAEWRLLAALMIAGPSSVNSLAAALGTDKGWISRTVTGLVNKELVKLSPDPDDARRFYIEPKAAGRALYNNILPAALARQRRLVSVLSSKEKSVLDELLMKLQVQAEALAEGTEGLEESPLATSEVPIDHHKAPKRAHKEK